MNTNFANTPIFITYLEAACILILILTLIVKELVRAYNGPGVEVWMKRLNIAIIPLMALFGLLVVIRLIRMF